MLRRQANGETLEAIAPSLIILTGIREAKSPSVASIYRAHAEDQRTQAYTEALGQAHAEFAVMRAT